MSSDEEGERMECCDTPAVPNNMLYSTSPLPKLSDPLILNNNERCATSQLGDVAQRHFLVIAIETLWHFFLFVYM